MGKVQMLAAGAAALLASGLGLLSATGSTVASVPSAVAAPMQQAPKQVTRELRRESVVPPAGVTGPAPRTGPASPFHALDMPNWGPNYRANTDTQTPNLAQQEPSISVNPTNPLNVVAAAKDERAGSNTKQVWIYTSTDGGATWINQIFPQRAPAAQFSSDPVVNWSDDGICYVTALPYGSGVGGIQVATSTDGGITFSTGALVSNSANADKEWTWVDNVPTSPYYHRLYEAFMDPPGSILRFSYSTDRGANWSSPVQIASAYQFPMPVSFPNGDVLVTYYNGIGVAAVRSTNGGVSFGGSQSIQPISGPNCPPDNSGCSIWRLSAIPATAVDRTNGNAVIVWSDSTGSGTATTYYTRSTNNGATWSVKAPLAASGISGTYQVEPWVEADETGIFHAIWYDDRESPNTSIFNIYYSQSTDDGATWSTAQRISTATSDLRIGIPSSYNRAAGDYINVTASHGNVYAVWTDTRSGTGEDVYVVRGTFGGTPTPTVTGTPPTSTPTTTRTATVTLTLTRTATPCAASTPVTGSITTSDPTQAGRLTRDSIASTCGAPKTCPGVFDNTARHYDAYTYTNNTNVAQCVTVTLGASGCGTSQIFSAAYAGTYDPNNLCGSYLADIGLSPVSSGSYSFSVAANQTYTVVIYEILANTGCASYTFSVSGCGTPASPTPTSTAQTSLTPTRTVSPTACTIQFTDVPVGSTFYTYIHCLFCRGIISGYPCGGPGEPCDGNNNPYFRPNAWVTRGQIAKIVSNSAGFQESPGAQVFEDVPPGNAFYPFINRLYNRGVMGGYPCGGTNPETGEAEPCIQPNNRPYFRPSNTATRGQLSKIVSNAAGYADTPTGQTFEDVGVTHPFYVWIERLTSRGVMGGYPCGGVNPETGQAEPCGTQSRPYFRPYNHVTRGQTAKIVANTFFPNCQTP